MSRPPCRCLGCLFFARDRAERMGKRDGFTWHDLAFRERGEGGPLVDATLEFALARTTKDQSHYCKGPLWNTLFERFNDCFILQIMDQNGLRPGSAIRVSVPGVRVAWVTKKVD